MHIHIYIRMCINICVRWWVRHQGMMSHTGMNHVDWCLEYDMHIYIYMYVFVCVCENVIKVACRTLEWVVLNGVEPLSLWRSHGHVPRRAATHMNESCVAHEWAMGQLSRSHVTHMKCVCRKLPLCTWIWHVTHLSASWLTCGEVIPHVWVRHAAMRMSRVIHMKVRVIHTNESCWLGCRAWRCLLSLSLSLFLCRSIASILSLAISLSCSYLSPSLSLSLSDERVICNACICIGQRICRPPPSSRILLESLSCPPSNAGAAARYHLDIYIYTCI